MKKTPSNPTPEKQTSQYIDFNGNAFRVGDFVLYKWHGKFKVSQVAELVDTYQTPVLGMWNQDMIFDLKDTLKINDDFVGPHWIKDFNPEGK